MTPTKMASIIMGVLVLFFLTFSVFIVREGQGALILRLGKIVSEKGDAPAVQGPGLHFKIPFVDYVRMFDMRTQELATPSSNPLTVVTKEQTYLLVEYFAKWRI